MNIHPLFVHFPIALFMVYAVMEVGGPILSRLLRTMKKEGTELAQFITGAVYKNIKGFLVIVGSLLAVPTLETGDMAEQVMRTASGDPRGFGATNAGQLIEMHSTFAGATVAIFAVLAVGYLCTWSKLSKYSFLNKLSNIILNPWVSGILVLAGIVVLTIAAALGGAITYGLDVDPIVQTIYGWFF